MIENKDGLLIVIDPNGNQVAVFPERLKGMAQQRDNDESRKVKPKRRGRPPKQK